MCKVAVWYPAGYRFPCLQQSFKYAAASDWAIAPHAPCQRCWGDFADAGLWKHLNLKPSLLPVLTLLFPAPYQMLRSSIPTFLRASKEFTKVEICLSCQMPALEMAIDLGKSCYALSFSTIKKKYQM